MSNLDNAIQSINTAAARTEGTTDFIDDLSTFDDNSSVTNPNNGATVPSIAKQVKTRTDELFAGAESDINQSVADAAKSASDAEASALSLGYQGLWPDTGGSALKGDTYQTQVGGAPTGQYFTALQDTSVDPIGDDVNWRVINSATTISTKTSGSTQDFIDSFALKIFQSPTDGSLTEIQTRTVDANEVYEVRKTSDGSLATIYSDEAGATEIVQNGTSNVSDSAGVVEFYIADGDYYIDADGSESSFVVGLGLSCGVGFKEAIQSKFQNKYTQKSSQFTGTSMAAVVGDSISHGNGVVDVVNDSWVGILRKLMCIDRESTNYGYANIRDVIVTSSGDGQEVHKVSWGVGEWNRRLGDQAEDVLNGWVYFGRASDGDMIITVPSFQNGFRVGFGTISGGGTSEVYVNDVLVGTLNHSGSSALWNGNKWSETFSIKDNGTGSCVIKIRPVGLTGVYGIYYADDFSEFSLSNWSLSGRKLIDLSKASISEALKVNDILFFALGVNDRNSTGADLDEYIERIDHLILRAETYKTKVVILDFIFSLEESNPVKEALLRAANEIENSVYINFSELFLSTGDLLTSTDLNDTYKFTHDGVHPTEFGHALIAEAVAKSIGLSVTSKAQSESNTPYWETLPLQNGWVNTSDSPLLSAAYKRNGNSLMFRMSVENTDMDNNLVITQWPNDRHGRPAQSMTVISSKSKSTYGVEFGFTNIAYDKQRNLVITDGATNTVSEVDYNDDLNVTTQIPLRS